MVNVPLIPIRSCKGNGSRAFPPGLCWPGGIDPAVDAESLGRTSADRHAPRRSQRASMQPRRTQETIAVRRGDAEVEGIAFPLHRKGNVDAGGSQSPDRAIEARERRDRFARDRVND